MAPTKQEVAQQFIRRREKNLAFFRKRYPPLYEHFKSLKMTRVEVQVSTEATDVDLKVDGQSWYHGQAAAYGKKEAGVFLSDYPQGKAIRSINPPFVEEMADQQFAAAALKKAISHSPVTRNNFSGYQVCNFLPSVVFMGVGLGYHLEALIQKVEILDVIVFEPDAEVFAATLFTIDWEAVCQRFCGKKGYSLRFVIATNAQSERQLQRLLEKELYKSEPLFPVTTAYYNHRAQSLPAAVAKAVGRDISGRLTAWGNYDDEVRRLNNLQHNVRGQARFVLPGADSTSSAPVLIVGSGPSIDERMEQIKAVRHKVLLVSAGTGLKALAANGLSPDFHVELDPQNLVYQHLAEVDPERIRGTTLLAVGEVNPLVPELFQDSLFYMKDSNPLVRLFGMEKEAFQLCHPTCTNAALSIFVQLGFTNLFLLGCDFGFKSYEHHHSADSIYGHKDNSEVARNLKEHVKSRYTDSSTFPVAGVDGQEVLSRADYHAAKQNMEIQIHYWKSQVDSLQVHNVSDGALIEGAPWLEEAAFLQRVNDPALPAATVDTCRQAMRLRELSFSEVQAEKLAASLVEALQKRTQLLNESGRSFRLKGKKDISRAALHLSGLNDQLQMDKGGQLPSPSAFCAAHLLSGTIKQFLISGYAHAMSHDTDQPVTPFLESWWQGFEQFLSQVPSHCEQVLRCDLSPIEDPMVNRSRWENEEEV